MSDIEIGHGVALTRGEARCGCHHGADASTLINRCSAEIRDTAPPSARLICVTYGHTEMRSGHHHYHHVLAVYALQDN